LTTFLRLLDVPADRKGTALAETAEAWRSGGDQEGIFQVESASLAQVPGSPFAYWVSERVRRLFAELPPFEGQGRTVKVGLQTSDDARFVRAWWEVDLGREKWFPLAKGGRYSPFYCDFNLVVNWGSTGAELKAFNSSLYGGTHWSKNLRNVDFYFRPGITYPRRMARFCPQAMPQGVITSVRGTGIYLPDALPAHLALLSSRVFDVLVKLLLGREGHPQFDGGALGRTPFPPLEDAEATTLGDLAGRGWAARRLPHTSAQTSHAFHLPALLQVSGTTIRSRLESWGTRIKSAEETEIAARAAINGIAYDLYGIGDQDRRRMEAGFDTIRSSEATTDTENDEADELEVEVADPVAVTETLLEWAFGVAIGRFDVRLATGQREPPRDPDPFDPLPWCSPGMMRDEEGFPAAEAPPGYPLELPPHGILVDDPGHPWDAVSRVEAVFDLVAGEHAHAWIQEAEAILGRGLRGWLRRYSFERHLKRYSRSRRKAPLFWHLAPKSREYGIWLHSPVATRDTLYRILNDYVAPKLKGSERRLLELRRDAGDSPTSQQRREVTSQESLVEELRAFREEVALVAPLWVPHRDDGVLLNCAVLWPLLDHHRAWQKECKQKWSELAKGKYDWAGWAMHLWPERVVGVCAEDRSIAIAHGLEDALWVEGDDGKWIPRDDAREQVVRLTDERRSAAVQAALDEFTRAG
jgi:hypothetical protein